MNAVETEIAIATEPREVWRVLTRFEHYGEWNPFITQIDGTPALGQTVTVHIHVAGHAALPIKAEIVTFRENAELVWRSHLLKEGLFDRDHIFRIEPNATGSLVFQKQTLEGAIAPAAAYLTEDAIRRGLENMNAALKRRVEQVGNN